MKSPSDYDKTSEAIIFVSWGITIVILVVLGIIWMFK